MITIDQLDKNLNDMLEGWLTKFTPLYDAVYQERIEMQERIFGKGNKGGSNQAGDKLPTTAYSNTPIYVSPKFSFFLHNRHYHFDKNIYGVIFQPTDQEEQAMLDYQGELIVEQINKQFNG